MSGQIRFVKIAILIVGVAVLTGKIFIAREDLTIQQGPFIFSISPNILITEQGLPIQQISG